jgi:predicted trehalose synthase
MNVLSWVTLTFSGLFCFGGTAPHDSTTDQSPKSMKIGTACSKTAVALPQAEDQKSLGGCQIAVRALVKSIVANLNVVANCREEYVQRTGQNLPGADTVSRQNRELHNMIPAIEYGAEQRPKNNTTLAQCKEQLSTISELADMQPELRGDWSYPIRR